MLSKFRESLDKFDDEKFLVDVSTPEGRKERILKLRRSRSGQIFVLIFLIGAMLLMGYLLPQADSSLLLLGFAVISFMTVIVTDIQIKMLLLFEQTQPKG